MIKINGQEFDFSEKNLLEFLQSTNYDLKKIAVEKNGEIVPKSQYAETILKNGDSVEVVSFVGGG